MFQQLFPFPFPFPLSYTVLIQRILFANLANSILSALSLGNCAFLLHNPTTVDPFLGVQGIDTLRLIFNERVPILALKTSMHV
jgi:hypothetical protein